MRLPSPDLVAKIPLDVLYALHHGLAAVHAAFEGAHGDKRGRNGGCTEVGGVDDRFDHAGAAADYTVMGGGSVTPFSF